MAAFAEPMVRIRLLPAESLEPTEAPASLLEGPARPDEAGLPYRERRADAGVASSGFVRWWASSTAMSGRSNPRPTVEAAVPLSDLRKSDCLPSTVKFPDISEVPYVSDLPVLANSRLLRDRCDVATMSCKVGGRPPKVSAGVLLLAMGGVGKTTN